MPHLGTRQVPRQRRAPRLLLRKRLLVGALERLELQADRLEIGFSRLLEEMPLLALQLLAARRELPALENRHLVGELVDTQLLERNLALGVRELGNQPGSELAQLIRVQLLQVLCAVHDDDRAISRRTTRSYAIRIVAASPSRCHGSPMTSARSCSVVSVSVLPAWAGAHVKLPWCSRRAHNQMPRPSCTSTFMRLARRFAKRYA